jgi:hypothetical protein
MIRALIVTILLGGGGMAAQTGDCVARPGCDFLRHGMSVFIGFPVRDLVMNPERGQRFHVVEALYGMEGAPGVVTVELSGGVGGRDELRTKAGRETVVPPSYLVVADHLGEDSFRQGFCMRALYAMDDPRVVQLLRERAEGVRVSLRGSARINYPWAPVPNVKIRLEGDDQTHRAVSDAKGSFQFPSLAPGRYQVVVESPGYENVSPWKDILVLPGGCGDLPIQLAAKTQVRGRLLYSNGSPGAKLPVSMMYVAPDRKLGTSAVPTHTLTDADGYFSFDKLRPGRYLMGTNLPGGVAPQAFAVPTTFYPGSFLWEEAKEIEVRVGEEVTELLYRLPDFGRKRKLTVEVVLEDGSPAVGAEVNARLHPRLGGSILSPEGRTDARGIAEFEIWPTTTYALYATRWERDWMSFPKDDDNVVQKGEGPVRVRLVLQPRVKK